MSGFLFIFTYIIKDNYMNKANGFAEWMLKIQSVHYANNEAMDRAYCKLTEYEKEKRD